MSREAPLLGITQKTIDRIDRQIDLFPNASSQIVYPVFKRMRMEQRELFKYIHHLKGGPVFNIAVAMTYKMIPRNHLQRTLSRDDVDFLNQKLNEANVIETINGHDQSRINFDWLEIKLEEDSPDFSKWMNEIVEELPTSKARSDFIFGSLFLIMPFYLRAEAEDIDRKLFGGNPS